MPSSLELRPVSTPSFLRACRRRVTLLMQPLTSAMTYPQAARSLAQVGSEILAAACTLLTHPHQADQSTKGFSQNASLLERPFRIQDRQDGPAADVRTPIDDTKRAKLRDLRHSSLGRTVAVRVDESPAGSGTQGGTFRGRPSPRESRIGFVVCYSQHGRSADWEIP